MVALVLAQMMVRVCIELVYVSDILNKITLCKSKNCLGVIVSHIISVFFIYLNNAHFPKDDIVHTKKD